MTTPSQPTSKFITVNGLRLHYLDWSNAGAPPVVCVHGYTSSAQAFNALARQLQDRLSEAQAQRMVEVLPHGELVAVPGVGHAPTLVEPVTIAALERFLSWADYEPVTGDR